MERNQIFKQLEDIFIDVFDLEDLRLQDSTTADDIEEWDSLSHIQMVVAVEKHFDIKFTALEIMSWKNVGQLVDTIEKRFE